MSDDSTMIFAGYDDLIIVWDLVTGSVLKRIKLSASNTQIYSISCKDHFLWAGGLDYMLRQVDLITGKIVKLIGFDRWVYAVLAVDEYVYVSGASSGAEVKKLSAVDGSILLEFNGHTSSVFTLCVHNDILYTGSTDKTIKSWNTETATQMHTGRE